MLVAPALLLLVSCQTSSRSATSRPSTGTPSVGTAPTVSPALRHLIYAAQNDGTVHVYDIDAGHSLLRAIRVFACCADVRGAAAAAPTHRFYVMYNRGSEGHVAALDLNNDQVVWDRILHSPGVDRGSVTPDGQTLYLPTWESDPGSPYELVVNAANGDVAARIPLPARSHDTLVSLDGRRVFMETKSATAVMHVVSTATNQVDETITGYCCGGVLAPFSVNGNGTRMVNDVLGLAGFQVADIATARVIATVRFGSGSSGHGIGWTPDEREVWVDDGAAALVHVFNMTVDPPAQTHTVSVSSPNPNWVTFSIDGRWAYVAGRKGRTDPTDVIDTGTYQRVASLGPSEDLLEVDINGSTVTSVGNQFGVGRAG